MERRRTGQASREPSLLVRRERCVAAEARPHVVAAVRRPRRSDRVQLDPRDAEPAERVDLSREDRRSKASALAEALQDEPLVPTDDVPVAAAEEPTLHRLGEE